MKRKELVERVKAAGHLKGNDEAERLLIAVIETLGQRLYSTERKKLSSEMPGDLKEILDRRKDFSFSRENRDRFSIQEFYNRVGERAGVGHRRAQRLTGAVMSVIIDGAVSRGTMNEILKNLPEEYRILAR